MPNTPERLARCKRMLERFAEKHSILVTDLQSQQAYEDVLYGAFEDYWFLFCGERLDGRFLWQPFETYRAPIQKQADSLYEVVRKWSTRTMGMLAQGVD